MAEHIPPGSKVYVVSGGGDFWRGILQESDEQLLGSWDVRTYLSEAEAKQWAPLAAAYAPHNPPQPLDGVGYVGATAPPDQQCMHG